VSIAVGRRTRVDGRSTFGQRTGRVATRRAVEVAEANGVGVVGIKDGAHLGRLGEWAERAAGEGMLFFAVANAQGGSQTVAPPGTAEPRLATNPITFGVPSFGVLPFSVVYDAATSQVANGKVRKRATAGESLPESWTTTPSGDPVTEASAFFDPETDGVLLPLGGRDAGYKGFGLAVAIELFSGLVGDGAVVGERDPKWFDNAGTFVAIDPLRFTMMETARERVRAVVEHVRSADASPSLSVGPGGRGDRALVPGKSEHEMETERLERGIPLDGGAVKSLLELSDDLGIEVPAALNE
jgi:uncharacterized oxidoreductase